MFRQLRLNNWRQFSCVDIAFHSRLTILTGANGSGKTTLLHLLNRHWGWDLHFLSSPPLGGKAEKKYWAGFWGNGDQRVEPGSERPNANRHAIGEIVYSNGTKAILHVPESVEEVFQVEIENQQGVKGVYVPSHSPAYIFKRITEIPAKLDAKEQIFNVYWSEVVSRYKGSRSKNSPCFQIKQSLISLATFGYGNKVVERNEEAVQIFEGFQNILKTVLPKSLRFREIRIRMPDVFLATDTGEFPLEAVSGGVAAIIDMAWQVHMYSQIHEEFVVVIDEPEAHLHPALQQSVLPDLLSAFPLCQFVVATHSPFIVTSLADSNVYVLTYNESGRVESSVLDTVNKSGSADEILMDVLGVPSTLPAWAQSKIDAILKQFTGVPLTQDSLTALKSEMNTVGMGHLFPQVLAKVAEAQK